MNLKTKLKGYNIRKPNQTQQMANDIENLIDKAKCEAVANQAREDFIDMGNALLDQMYKLEFNGWYKEGDMIEAEEMKECFLRDREGK